jgi:hypothetical protein
MKSLNDEQMDSVSGGDVFDSVSSWGIFNNTGPVTPVIPDTPLFLSARQP